MKRMFRLTHRESGGEKKKTFGYGTKTEEKLLLVSLFGRKVIFFTFVVFEFERYMR